jgi:isochorismate hydrolase
MAGRAEVLQRALVVVQVARRLGLPVFVTEQYPKGLGRTVEELVAALGEGYLPYAKTAFSAWQAPGLREAVRAVGARSLLVAGVESHVCVLQTVLDLLDRAFHVFVVADAVSSRHAENRELGLQRMRQAGAVLVSTEMLLFELLATADTPDFKPLQQLIQ